MFDELNKKLANAVIPMFIMLAPYAILKQFYSVGLFICLLYSLFSVSFLKNDFVIPKSLLWFFLSFSGIYTINIIRNGDQSLGMINFIIGAILTFFYIGSLIKYFEFERFYKTYKILCLVSCGLVIYQGIRLFFWGVPAVPINLLPVAEADYNYWDFFKGERPSGFFSEPQAFCSFILPFFIFSLYRKEYLLSIFTFIAILLSASTLGLGISIIITVYFMFFEKERAKSSKIFIASGFFLIFGILAYFGMLDTSVEKISKTPLENNIRLVRGFYIYSKFNPIDLFLGISSDLQKYVLSNVKESWVSLYTSSGNERLLGYTTSFSGLLIQFGLPSFILYLMFLWKCFVNSSKDSKVLVLVTFALCFVQTIIFNAWFVFYVSIILGMLYEQKKIKFLTIRL
tara:strand:- start:4053 stop:5249 length:1197 start_codon:yes stop_codon:yes gene_type:complete